MRGQLHPGQGQLLEAGRHRLRLPGALHRGKLLYSPEGAHRNLCPVQASSYQSCNSILPQASSYKSDIRHFSVDDEDYDSLCDKDKQRLL